MKIAYLTGEYPRATDTFIQREVAGLRDAGLAVETCSIRRTGSEHHVGEEQRTEAARTFHVLEARRTPPTLSVRISIGSCAAPGPGCAHWRWPSAPHRGARGRCFIN